MATKPYRRKEQRRKRHKRIRLNLAGNQGRPRLCIYRSLTNIYAQLIDDNNRVTLASASSLKMNVKPKEGESLRMAQAREVGKVIAESAQAKGIKNVVFDRGGFLYHGRVKALADAVREAGVEF